MTIPCTLPCSRNYLFEPSKQHFVDHPVQYTPVTINAKNGNLHVHFINHSDHEVVIPRHSHHEVVIPTHNYDGAMEKVQELTQGIVHTDTSPEPVSQHAFSECLTHSDLLPNQRQSLGTVLPENSGVFGYSIADLTITPPVKHSVDTGNAKPIKQRAYRASHHHLKNIEKQVQEMLQNDIFKPSVSPWASLVTLLSKLPYTIPLISHYHLFGGHW